METQNMKRIILTVRDINTLLREHFRAREVEDVKDIVVEWRLGDHPSKFAVTVDMIYEEGD